MRRRPGTDLRLRGPKFKQIIDKKAGEELSDFHGKMKVKKEIKNKSI